MSGRRHQRGFTLLEMIVAMALSALVSLIGAMALGAGADFYARSGLRQHSHADIRAAERTMRIEWETRGSSIALAPDAIEFDTTTPVTMLTTPGVATIRYQCLSDGDGRFKLVSETKPLAPDPGRSAPAGSANGPGTPVAQVLITGLTACGFAALQNRVDQAGRVSTAWVDSWSSKDRSPQLMRVKLTGQFGDMPSMVFVAMRA